MGGGGPAGWKRPVELGAVIFFSLFRVIFLDKGRERQKQKNKQTTTTSLPIFSPTLSILESERYREREGVIYLFETKNCERQGASLHDHQKK